MDAFPILKAESIKYLISFRSALPTDGVKHTIPFLLKFLVAKSPVVHSYASSAIDKILLLQANDKPIVTSDELSGIANTFYANALTALSITGSEQNEYVMRAMMRVTSLLDHAAVMQNAQVLVPQLVVKLQTVAKNPTKPHYIHFLFETLSLIIKVVCLSVNNAVLEFDRNLFPIFQEILQNEVDSLIPYVFQILSLLLERQNSEIPEAYMQLLPFLVLPALWERPGYVGPMVRLLQTYIEKAHFSIIRLGKLEAVLGVFNKLNASKTNDHEGFRLLQAILLHIPAETIDQYWNSIFTLLFKRLTSSKTAKYVKCLLVFFSLFSCQYSVHKLIGHIDGLQNNMFAMVVQRLIVPDLQKVTGDIEKKLCVVGITNMISDSEVYMGRYISLWSTLVQTLINFLENPVDTSHPLGEHFVDVDDSSMFHGTSSSCLTNASKEHLDPLGGKIDNPKAYFVQKLMELNQLQSAAMQERLKESPTDVQMRVLSYLQNAGKAA